MKTTYKNRPLYQKGYPLFIWGITDANDIMGARLCDSLHQGFLPLVGKRYTVRPTNGRGTTSRLASQNRFALIRQQALLALLPG
jgi:hypothetical protein